MKDRSIRVRYYAPSGVSISGTGVLETVVVGQDRRQETGDRRQRQEYDNGYIWLSLDVDASPCFLNIITGKKHSSMKKFPYESKMSPAFSGPGQACRFYVVQL